MPANVQFIRSKDHACKILKIPPSKKLTAEIIAEYFKNQMRLSHDDKNPRADEPEAWIVYDARTFLLDSLNIAKNMNFAYSDRNKEILRQLAEEISSYIVQLNRFRTNTDFNPFFKILDDCIMDLKDLCEHSSSTGPILIDGIRQTISSEMATDRATRYSPAKVATIAGTGMGVMTLLGWAVCYGALVPALLTTTSFLIIGLCISLTAGVAMATSGFFARKDAYRVYDEATNAIIKALNCADEKFKAPDNSATHMPPATMSLEAY